MNAKKRQHDYNELKDIHFGEHEIEQVLKMTGFSYLVYNINRYVQVSNL